MTPWSRIHDTIAAGLLWLYLAGAFLSVIAGNALVLVIGSAWRQLSSPELSPSPP